MRHKKLKIDIFYCSKTFDIEEAFIKSREEAELRSLMKGATILKLIKSSCIKVKLYSKILNVFFFLFDMIL